MKRALLVLLSISAGCTEGGTPELPDGSFPDAGPSGVCSVGIPGIRCSGDTAVDCLEDGTAGTVTDCAASGLSCFDGFGCANCAPNSFSCDGDDLQQCDAEGNAVTTVETCTGGEVCVAALHVCLDLCQDAALSESYMGCEYWPTTAMNPVFEGFEFAVVVTNPQLAPAEVTVTRGTTEVFAGTIAPGAVETIRLPWVDALKETAVTMTGAAPQARSALVPEGAYRLRSNVPVTAYQFNPLEYRLDADCPDSPTDVPDDGQCFSYTNDASLLLPTHVLTGNYIAVSRASRHQHVTVTRATGGRLLGEFYASFPGFISIVGASDTPVTVEVTLSANTAQSEDGAVAAGTPGETQTYTLNAGDVLQLATSGPPDASCTPAGTDRVLRSCTGTPCYYEYEYCADQAAYDLTGTEIRASGPVMVLGGHECAFVPNTVWACDHLEESVFPLDAWGSDFIVTATEPVRDEPNLVRIVSGVDANELTFEPASVHAAVTLGRGEMIEFETSDDFRVRGSAGAILVTQFLVGQDYGGVGSSGEMGVGDPSMSFAIPTDQFRTSYSFLAPTTYERSFVNVVAPVGAQVRLSSNGGEPADVTGWVPIGTTGMQRARVEIPGGTHLIESGAEIGIVVYGFGSFTSYMYPGGLDLEEINPLI